MAANGVAYLAQEARPGIIPRLLQEILSTRIMVKAAMKSTPGSQKVLQRVMNARQFGLKLIANVTYGYTSAGFSGRMPMAEIADSIVQVPPSPPAPTTQLCTLLLLILIRSEQRR